MNSARFNYLIKRIKIDKRAFNILYDRYFVAISRHIARKFYSYGIDGEDVAQETFLKLLRTRITEYITDPATWLYVISDRIAIEIIRRTHPIVEYVDDFVGHECIDEFFERENISQILNAVEPDSDKILYLHYCELYTLKEISRILNINYNTVRQKSRRALKFYKKI